MCVAEFPVALALPDKANGLGGGGGDKKKRLVAVTAPALAVSLLDTATELLYYWGFAVWIAYSTICPDCVEGGPWHTSCANFG